VAASARGIARLALRDRRHCRRLAVPNASVFAGSIRASQAATRSAAPVLFDFEAMALMAIACFQPVTRTDLSKIFGKEVSRDTIASLRNANFLASDPRSPTPGVCLLLECGRCAIYQISRCWRTLGCPTRRVVQEEVPAAAEGEEE